MDTTTIITAAQLRKRMKERGISVGDLARACGLYTTNVSSYLSGGMRVGPKAEMRLAAGIVRLGLDREQPQPKPPAEQVVIRIRPW